MNDRGIERDPFTVEIIRDQLIAAAEESFIRLGRSSQSLIIYEVLDNACALTDEHGPQEALRKSILHGRKIRTLAMDGSTRSDFLLPLRCIYLPERLGVRLEDIVVVVPGGVRVLTGFDRQFVLK